MRKVSGMEIDLERLGRLCERNDIGRLRVFGSVARRDAYNVSAVDNSTHSRAKGQHFQDGIDQHRLRGRARAPIHERMPRDRHQEFLKVLREVERSVEPGLDIPGRSRNAGGDPRGYPYLEADEAPPPSPTRLVSSTTGSSPHRSGGDRDGQRGG